MNKKPSKKLIAISDKLMELEITLQPLQAISVIRSSCNEILEPSEVQDYEETAWTKVGELLGSIQSNI